MANGLSVEEWRALAAVENEDKRRTTLQIFAKIYLYELPLLFQKFIRVLRRIEKQVFFGGFIFFPFFLLFFFFLLICF